jgi:hypothetical protein
MTETTELHQELGILERMIRTFHSPSETFSAMRNSQSWHDWFVPTLVVAVATLISGIFLMPVTEQLSTEAIAQMMKDATAEQQQMMEGLKGPMQVVGVVAAFCLVFVWLVVVGALLLLLSNFVLGGNATFSQMMGVFAYASLIDIVHLAVITPWIMAVEKIEVYTGLGILLSNPPSTFLSHLVAGVDFFSIWQIFILAIGMATMAGLDSRRSLTALLVTWGIYLIGKAGLAGIGTYFEQLAAGGM